MGTSGSPAELAGKLERAAVALRDAEGDAVKETAFIGKQIFNANLGARSLRGVGKKGARVGARYSTAGGISSTTAILGYFGPVHLLNNDTSAHEITPKARRGAQALKVGDGFAAVVQHPGTTGRRFHERSVREVQVLSRRVLDHQVSSALNRVF